MKVVPTKMFIMKTTILTVLIIVTSNWKTLANGRVPINSTDTVFILLKNDDEINNEVWEGINASGYDIYGFMRDRKPRDFIDSLGYLRMSIHLSKDTLAVYKLAACEQSLSEKLISLYDLRDSLKAHMDLNYYRKHRPPIPYRSEDRTLLDPQRHVLVLVIPKNDVCYLRRISNIDYFYKHGD
jgi:hypothetical protein